MRLYNTLTRQKEDFVPLNPPRVKMYVCGPTVYNFLHVGNFRGPVVMNLLRNWLEYRGHEVSYVLNFTDVDDRILETALKEGVPASEISERYIREYKTDFQALGLKAHEANPKVTETMPEIISFIEKLIAQGKAYVSGGDVLYSVRSFAEYGKLSGRKVDDLRSGARVEVDEKKSDPLDFALWKAAKPNEKWFWPSPWGDGRPGWHIECSAMVCKHLGEQIDIHGGGSDLMFPHHENEIAQSEGALGGRFVKTWIHWSMLNFGGQKMSKSLGNFMTLRDFLKIYHPEIYKWMILSVHHRHVADFDDDAVARAVSGLARVYSAMALAGSVLPEAGPESGLRDEAFLKVTAEAWGRIEEALDDDLGTPEAFAAMFDVIRSFNGQVRRGVKNSPVVQAKAIAFLEFMSRFGEILSLFREPAESFLRDLDDLLLEKKELRREAVQELVDQRARARAAKDFAESDRLRDQLSAMGIAVSDTPQGSFWEVAK